MFTPDFTEYNRLYENDIVLNDVDLALRNKQLRSIIDGMMVDVSPSEGVQLSDDEYMETFTGKELEVDELNAIAHARYDQFVKEQKKSNNERS